MRISYPFDSSFYQKTQTGAFFYILVQHGKATFELDSVAVDVQRGQMLLAAPRMNIKMCQGSRDLSAMGVRIDPPFYDRLPFSNYMYKHLYTSSYDTPLLMLGEEDVGLLVKTLELLDHYARLRRMEEMASLLIHVFFLQLMEVMQVQEKNISGSVTRPDELYREFRRLLALHFKKEHRISFYADSLHVSEVYLSRTVHSVSGHTVRYYITRVLLYEAKRLLVMKDVSIKEIAEQLGFADQSSFGKFFKKESGTSPLTFRSKFTPGPSESQPLCASNLP